MFKPCDTKNMILWTVWKINMIKEGRNKIQNLSPKLKFGRDHLSLELLDFQTKTDFLNNIARSNCYGNSPSTPRSNISIRNSLCNYTWPAYNELFTSETQCTWWSNSDYNLYIIVTNSFAQIYGHLWAQFLLFKSLNKH